MASGISSVEVTVETPGENQVIEVTYDGQEILQPPLTLAEHFAKQAGKIDFETVMDESSSPRSGYFVYFSMFWYTHKNWECHVMKNKTGYEVKGQKKSHCHWVLLARNVQYSDFHLCIKVIEQGWPDFFARGQILNIIFLLGPHISAKQNFFKVFLMLIEKN